MRQNFIEIDLEWYFFNHSQYIFLYFLLIKGVFLPIQQIKNRPSGVYEVNETVSRNWQVRFIKSETGTVCLVTVQ